jgi:hypothetical protein
MTDRELLEAAAKAAGIEFGWIHDTPRIRAEMGWTPWNPLTDDGDALRLAVKLGFTVGPHLGATYAGVAPCPDDFEDGKLPIRIAQMHNGDPLAATRRAIVRAAAAAEIGNGTTQKVSTDDFPEDNYYKTQAEAEELGRNKV